MYYKVCAEQFAFYRQNTPLRNFLNHPLPNIMQQRRGYLRHTKVRILNSINSQRYTIINDKQEVYLEYGTQFRHAWSSIHDNLTKLTHGQCLYSVASRPESCQVAFETFRGTSILNCVYARTHIPQLRHLISLCSHNLKLSASRYARFSELTNTERLIST
jgi:hypothetical protein